MSQEFRAFVVNKTDVGFSAGLQEISTDQLPQGEVLIKVAYSCVNYKDGLASSESGKVARKFPMIPGVDLSGTVVESSDPNFKAGDEIIATSYDIGVAHDGGFGQYARIPAKWLVPLPKGLSLKEAMMLGTAGFTAGMAIHMLQLTSVKPESGAVLITGATGGVGSIGVNILAGLGYTVAASTGKETEHAYLKSLGASEIISRAEAAAESNRPMEKERWAGSIDNVGGSTLAYLARTTQAFGSIAACGNTGGITLNTTVFPFILRGVNLLGINSAECPMGWRREVWEKLAGEWKPAKLSEIAFDANLDELPGILEKILKAQTRGRAVISLW
jgi:putative YhdH/YhfP family quinone oxidoreductase